MRWAESQLSTGAADARYALVNRQQDSLVSFLLMGSNNYSFVGDDFPIRIGTFFSAGHGLRIYSPFAGPRVALDLEQDFSATPLARILQRSGIGGGTEPELIVGAENAAGVRSAWHFSTNNGVGPSAELLLGSMSAIHANKIGPDDLEVGISEFPFAGNIDGSTSLIVGSPNSNPGVAPRFAYVPIIVPDNPAFPGTSTLSLVLGNFSDLWECVLGQAPAQVSLNRTDFIWRNTALLCRMALSQAGELAVEDSYRVGLNKVVGAQGAAVADATGPLDIVAQFNTLLARLRAATGHGLIA